MSGVIRGTDAIFLDGPCPFLTCLETGPHGHDVCPDCGAVRFGNMCCRTCIERSPYSDEMRAILLAVVDRDERGQSHEKG